MSNNLYRCGSQRCSTFYSLPKSSRRWDFYKKEILYNPPYELNGKLAKKHTSPVSVEKKEFKVLKNIKPKDHNFLNYTTQDTSSTTPRVFHTDNLIKNKTSIKNKCNNYSNSGIGELLKHESYQVSNISNLKANTRHGISNTYKSNFSFDSNNKVSSFKYKIGLKKTDFSKYSEKSQLHFLPGDNKRIESEINDDFENYNKFNKSNANFKPKLKNLDSKSFKKEYHSYIKRNLSMDQTMHDIYFNNNADRLKEKNKVVNNFHKNKDDQNIIKRCNSKQEYKTNNTSLNKIKNDKSVKNKNISDDKLLIFKNYVFNYANKTSTTNKKKKEIQIKENNILNKLTEQLKKSKNKNIFSINSQNKIVIGQNTGLKIQNICQQENNEVKNIIDNIYNPVYQVCSHKKTFGLISNKIFGSKKNLIFTKNK